jgi:ABC-type enterochelin transport system permease subunit
MLQQAIALAMAGTHPLATMLLLVLVVGVPFITICVFLDIITRPHKYLPKDRRGK